MRPTMQIIFVCDPQSSRCLDFLPQLSRLREHLQEKAAFSLLLGTPEDARRHGELTRLAICSARESGEEKAFELLFACCSGPAGNGAPAASEDLLLQTAERIGLEKTRFSALLRSDAMRERLLVDRRKAKAYGASLLPSLVVIDTEGHLSTLRGCRSFEETVRLLGL